MRALCSSTITPGRGGDSCAPSELPWEGRPGPRGLRLRDPAPSLRPALLAPVRPLGVAAAAVAWERGGFEGAGALPSADEGSQEGGKGGRSGGRRRRRAARG